MVEWWQALLLLAAGSTIGLVTSYAAHRWTTGANRESEERHFKQLAQEERARATRELRRERLKSISQFVQLARGHVAEFRVAKEVDESYKRAGQDKKRNVTLDEWRQRFGSPLHDSDSQVQRAVLMELARAGRMASAGSPTSDLQEALRDAIDIVFGLFAGDDQKSKDMARAEEALRHVERLAETYIVEV